MKPAILAGCLSLLLGVDAVSAQPNSLIPFDQRLPAPPKAKPLTQQEQAKVARQQGASGNPVGHRVEDFSAQLQQGGEMPGLSRFAPDAKAFTGKPLNPEEPLNLTLVSPGHEQVMNSGTVQLVLDVQNFAMAPDGNRLHIILDNGSPIPYSGFKNPVILRGLAPGGHTLQVYAVGPDGRMLKTPGSYLLRHFFVRQNDVNNYVAPDQPYLTVNLPSDGPVVIPADSKIWFDFHAHNAKLGTDGPYQVHYRINGLHHQLDRDQGVFWENLHPGRYELEVMLRTKEGQPVPGLLAATKRTFLLAPALGDAPAPVTTPNPSVVFDQVPGYDPSPAAASHGRTFAPMPSTQREFAPLPANSPFSPGGNPTTRTATPANDASTSEAGANTAPPAPPEEQKVIRSAPAVSEEEAEKKDEGTIDLDAN